MKTPVSYFCLLIFLLPFAFSSCEQQPALEFEEPQPANVKNANEFKKKFRGEYLSLEDTSVLQILPNLLIRKSSYLFHVSKKDLDTMKDYSIQNNRLYGPEFSTGVNFLLKNDTLEFSSNSVDTLFKVDGNENIIRFYKGHYYLNHKTPQNRWRLSSLSFNKDGKLLYTAVTDSTDLKNMQEITNVDSVLDTEGKTVAHISKPAKKEFKKFVKKGGFHKYEEFVKIGK